MKLEPLKNSNRATNRGLNPEISAGNRGVTINPLKKVHKLNEKGMGFFEFLFWIALLGGVGYLIWNLVTHPENLKPRPETHSSYEDKKP